MKTRKITQADLKLGMLVPWNVYGDNGMLLVRKGHMIASANQIDYLVERGSVEDDSEPAAEQREPASAVRKLNQALLQLDPLLSAIAARRAPAGIRRMLEEVATLVAEAVELNADVAVACVLHNQHAAPYPVRHCVDTAVVARVAARALKTSEAVMASITLAALTMNVGMLEQHERLHGSQTELGEVDKSRLRSHPEVGVALLRQAGITDQHWLDCVLHHHENEDGSGYPNGLPGTSIPTGAKLIALADRYCARVSNRGYRKPMLPNAALRDILLEKSALDGQLTAILIKELGIYPIGTYVRLLNGEIAVVARKGLQTTTPHVESIIGPRGAPLDVFLQRDTRGDLNGIKAVLPVEEVDAIAAPLRMERVWGRVASP